MLMYKIYIQRISNIIGIFVCVAMMTSSNGNIFGIAGPLWGGSTSQMPAMQSFDVFFDLTWTNRWANNGDADFFRWHHINYDGTVMILNEFDCRCCISLNIHRNVIKWNSDTFYILEVIFQSRAQRCMIWWICASLMPCLVRDRSMICKLIHCGQVMYICVSKLNIIDWQAIIWNNTGILSIGPLGTNLKKN